MNYTFTSSLQTNIRFGGCSFYEHYNLFYVKFKIGSIVYSKPKALKGIIEKFVIKDIKLKSLNTNFSHITPLYIDTLNAYHNEEDLIGPDEAVLIVDNYLLSRAKKVEQSSIDRC